MKKSIIALMGLFMLVACSEDAFQEADKMSETGNVENTDPQNQVNTYDPTIPYESPFDITIANTLNPFPYQFINTQNFIVELTPYVGIAYYDGRDDGFYYGSNFSSDFVTEGFTNIYSSNKEYLNLIEGAVITLNPFDVFSTGDTHLPIFPVSPVYFDLSSNAIPQETHFLGACGKLYYLDVTIKDSFGNFIDSTKLKLRFGGNSFVTPPSNFSNWVYLGQITSEPEDFYYNINSKEIVTGNSPSGAVDIYYFNGGANTVSLFSDANGVYFRVD